VIDTSVGRGCAGAGSQSVHGRNCRSAVEAVGAGGHRAVVYPTLLDEYGRQENMSRFFLRWLGDMRAKRRIENLPQDPPPFQDIRSAMKRLVPVDAHHIVKKDIHLAAAAIATDERVLSDDDKVRAHLCTIAAAVTTLGRVHWANPSGPGCLDWLARGAPDEPVHQLAFG
jgi:hypothetical protein